MRYLHKRSEFLKSRSETFTNEKLHNQIKSSSLINETFENNISWGESLIGRLINSTIRVAKIYVKTGLILRQISALETALNDLLVLSRTSEEQRTKISSTKVQFLLEDIIKVVNSNESVKSKVAKLLGDDNSANPGMIQITINVVKESEDLPDKETLIQKLEDFKESLKTISENIDELPEQGEDDEEGEEDKNQEEGQSEEDGEDGDGQGVEKSIPSQFQFSVITLFKSLISLSVTIKNKRVAIEGDTTSAVNLSKSQSVIYTDPKGRKIRALILSVDNPVIGTGPDKVFVTKDDQVDNAKKVTPKVQIIVKNPKTGKFDMGSNRILVDPKTLKKESFVFENSTEIKNKETHAKSAWKKIEKEYLASNLDSQVPLMEKFMEMRKQSDKSVFGLMKALMNQVFENEKTEGKIISFQDLIKENVNILQTEFKNLPKTISLMGRVIMAFKEDMGLLQSMGEAQKPLESFIKSYDSLKSLLPKLSTEKTQEKPVEKKEEKGKVNNDKNESLRIFEAGENEDGQTQGEGQEDEGGEDEVKSAWRQQFTEEEEKKYAVNENSAQELQNAVDGNKKSKIDISDEKQYDKILEIVEIFGKAYRLYAVTVIPSGRPNGMISQKTFREYEFIGKDGSPGSSADWTEDRGPGYGPWAVVMTYQKWQDGVMKLLKNTQYRAFLANSEFVNSGPNQEKGSGPTLFQFINDMLNEGGEDSNFRQRRHRLLTKYFGANAGGLEDEAGSGNPNENPPVSPDDAGDPNTLTRLVCQKRFFEVRDIRQDKSTFLNKFFIITGKDKVSGQALQLLTFFDFHPKPSDVNDKNVLVMKFQQTVPNKKSKQSIITSYLDKQINKDKNLKLSEDVFEFSAGLPINIGVVVFEKTRIFEINQITKIKYIRARTLKTDEPREIEIMVTKMEFVGYTKEDKKTLEYAVSNRGDEKLLQNDLDETTIITYIKSDLGKKKFNLLKKK